MKNRFYFYFIQILFFLVICSCKSEQKTISKPVKIAFLADVHLQDIHANFTDANYKGIKNPTTGSYNTIRTMGSQLRSTRLFNENYFAFKTALDEIVSRNITLVVLPGDFSDDGQPINIKALKKILDDYTVNHGIQFFLTTGNHDPVRPYSREAGKTNFLGAQGNELAILSDSSLISSNHKLHPIISSEIKQWGYLEILNELSSFGFFPKKEFLYWETPFSLYDYDNYTLTEAASNAAIEKRKFSDNQEQISIPDASYLVEPIKDIWLLGIDANIYIPSGNSSKINETSSASIGYNNILTHKKHLLPWIRKVSSEAEKQKKILIAFSHYPMVEFYDGASKEMEQLFGEDKMQMHRVPKDTIAELFTDLGIQLHFGGHMHMNDTGIHKSTSGKTLYNIQTPSLAGYIPAFKILTINSKEEMEIETVVVDSVSHFNSLFRLYEQEHQHLKKSATNTIWDKEILASKTYINFTEQHLKELVRLRFLKNDWPAELITKLEKSTGNDLLKLELKNTKSIPAIGKLSKNKPEYMALNKWTGLDMVYDFYKLRNAGELAKGKIGSKRLAQYELICKHLMNCENLEISLWGNIFYKAMHGHPSGNFMINLKTNTIERL